MWFTGASDVRFAWAKECHVTRGSLRECGREECGVYCESGRSGRPLLDAGVWAWLSILSDGRFFM